MVVTQSNDNANNKPGGTVMELIERYVSECIRHLPTKMRDDVHQELTVELTHLVEDEINSGASEHMALGNVLKSMGNPRVLADRYLDKKAYLIGPRYYYTYLMVVKIVLLAITLGLSVAFGIRILFDFETLLLSSFFSYISSIVMVGLQAVAWITIIFTLIERFETTEIMDEIDDWSINDLPKSKKTVTKHKKVESLLGVAFSILALLLLNTQLDLLGVYIFAQGQIQSIVPILNMETATDWLPWLNISILFILIKNGLQVASAYYDRQIQGIILFFQFISIALFVLTFVLYQPFNPLLASSIALGNQELANLWNNVTQGFPWFILLLGILDMGGQLISNNR